MPTVNKRSKPAPWKPKREPFENQERRAWRESLYNSWKWRKMAKVEIMNEPQCAECARHGIVTVENLQRDHVNGFETEHEFWFGERQTLCKWHNMQKAQKLGGKTTSERRKK